MKLTAQSADGKGVRLLWTIKSWSSSYTGFDIRRRQGAQGWVKLNTAPILPGISTKRNFKNSGNNIYDESLVKPKMYKLLRTNKLRDLDMNKYLQLLMNSDSALKAANRMMAEDYDIAMMNGFGYVDHTVTQKTTIQYGLFIQGTDKLLAQTTWNYGAIPDLDVIQELTSSAVPGKNGIKVMWIADTPKINKNHVAGFNIYRNGIRLNTSRIPPASADSPFLFVWNDAYGNSSKPALYSIAAETIFNIEGIIRSYAYDPQDHPLEHKHPEVTEIAPIGYYFKDGTGIKWSFPREYERYIKGFIIEKDNVPVGFKQVSGIIEPSARSYTDKTPSQVNGYIKARITAVYLDRTFQPGPEKLFYYFPVNEPLPPQHVKANRSIAGGQATANISWDLPLAGDSITDGYKVYLLDPDNNRLVPVSDQIIHSNNFTYTIQSSAEATYRFCVTSVSKNRSESGFSDTVSVQVPNMGFPAPKITNVQADNENKATIEWQFPDLPDLKGFRVLENNTVIAGETVLDKASRSYVTGKLEPGAAYEFTVVAVTRSGDLSKTSGAFHVVVTRPTDR